MQYFCNVDLVLICFLGFRAPKHCLFSLKRNAFSENQLNVINHPKYVFSLFVAFKKAVFYFCFYHMVCCNPSIRIDKVILVVHNIVLETLSSNTIVSTPHVAPNFCPWSDPLHDERHQCSGIPTWNWQQEAFLGCRIITSKNPLFRYYSPSVVFSSGK